MFPQYGRRVAFYALNIGAICRQDATTENLVGDDRTAWSQMLAFIIDSTKKCLRIKFFAGDVGVIDFALVFELFKTTTAATATFGFPI